MKKTNQQILAVAVMLITLIGCGGSKPLLSSGTIQTPSEAPRRILFVGNSYQYYNDSLHSHVRRMAGIAGPHPASEYTYKSATISGASLAHHPIDWLLTPGRLGVSEPFELVILQGGSFEGLSAAGAQAFQATAAEFAQKIRAGGASVALYMTHAYVPPHRRYDPAMIDKVARMYVDTGRAIGARVIPVGLAFARAYRERPGIALHKDFDGSHPSLLGTYLAACVVYASIYAEDPIGIDYDYFGAVAADDARFLQRIAAEAVAEFDR